MVAQKRGLKDKERRAYALRMAIQMGCSGAHKMPDGSWAPCASHEELERLSDAAEESDWLSDNTLSALRARDRRARRLKLKSAPKDQMGRKTKMNRLGGSFYSFIAGKSAVPMAAPRDTDPDVFVDPDSARVRSRQLGCIGISRRISKSGRTIWMPCTNMADYNRLSRSTALGRRGSDAARERQVRQTVRDELRRQARKR
jgi:hypothetical protein